MKSFRNEMITPACTFKDPDFELSYLTHAFLRFKPVLIPCFTAIMILYFCFFIPELIYESDVLGKNMILRTSAILLFTAFYFIFGRFENYKSYLVTLNAIEIGFIIFYILILLNLPSMNYVLKCMDIIIITSVFFVFPNKWLFAICNSLILISSFFVFSAIFSARYTQDSNFAGGSSYILISLALNAINSYRINFYKRSQFYKTTVLKKMINTDTLTGAFTRAKFNEDLKKQITISRQTGRRFCIMLFDIDNFKHINDTYGHIEGDHVLTGIANAITANKRTKDILIRWGGEEFVVLLPSTALSAAAKITERFRAVIESMDHNIGEQVTCSFGVTEFRPEDTDDSLLRRVDNYLYAAKAKGKNAVISDFQY